MNTTKKNETNEKKETKLMSHSEFEVAVATEVKKFKDGLDKYFRN